MQGSSPTRACEFADDILLVRPHGFGPGPRSTGPTARFGSSLIPSATPRGNRSHDTPASCHQKRFDRSTKGLLTIDESSSSQPQMTRGKAGFGHGVLPASGLGRAPRARLPVCDVNVGAGHAAAGHRSRVGDHSDGAEADRAAGHVAADVQGVVR